MSKFRAENGRLQTHQPRKWNSHYRAEPEQRILCLFLLIFNFALAGAQTDQSQNLPWKNETRGLSKSAITQFLLFFNTCYHYPYLPQPDLNSFTTPGRVQPLRRGRGRAPSPAHRGLGRWEHWARCPGWPQPQQGPHTGVLHGEISSWGAFTWARLLEWHISAAG